MKISEIFYSIQGEGRYSGVPMLFIRTSGCTRACSFCDTKYHIKGNEEPVIKIIKLIKWYNAKIVCFTGGEPLLHFKEIKEIMIAFKDKDIQFHIETNGDLLNEENTLYFSYFGCSPKELKTAKKVKSLFKRIGIRKDEYDIKVVTDLKTTGKDMLKYATLLMPLTTYNRKKDIEICKNVWQYCVKNNIKFSPRLQYFIWGKKKKV